MCLLDILDRHDTDTAIGIINHKQLFDTELVQQTLCLVPADTFANRDEVFLRHQLADRLVRIGCKPDIPVGQHPDQLAGATFNNRQTGNTIGRHQVKCLLQGGVRRDGQGIDDHSGLKPFDPPDLGRLLFRCHVLVNNADTTMLCHGDGQPRFGHRIHRRRDQRDVERDVFCELRCSLCLIGKNARFLGDQKNVVECESLFDLHAASRTELAAEYMPSRVKAKR